MITSDRDVYVAGHVTQPVKDGLLQWKKKNDRSMSAFIAEAIEEKLRAEGIEIVDEPVYTGEVLPFVAPVEPDVAHP